MAVCICLMIAWALVCAAGTHRAVRQAGRGAQVYGKAAGLGSGWPVKASGELPPSIITKAFGALDFFIQSYKDSSHALCDFSGSRSQTGSLETEEASKSSMKTES